MRFIVLALFLVGCAPTEDPVVVGDKRTQVFTACLDRAKTENQAIDKKVVSACKYAALAMYPS